MDCWPLFLIASWLAVAGCGKDKSGTAASSGSATGSAGSSESIATPAPPLVALPQVAGHGYDRDPPTPRVVATPAAIFVDGKQVLALENGAVPGTPRERTINAVVNGLSAPSREPRMVIAVDKGLPYRLLVDLLLTLRSQGVRSFGVLAQAGSATVMLPLDLPDASRVPSTDVGRHPDLQRQIDEVRGAGRAVEVKSGVSVEVREASVSPESSLGGQIVKTKISAAYLAGIKRCVAKSTARDATPGGAIELTFAITETGRGEKATVVGAPPGAADCIAAQTASWIFPKPKSGDIEGTPATAKVTLDVAHHEADDKADSPAIPGSADTEAVSVQTMSSPDPGPDAAPLRMVVSITTSDVTVWSISGLEGTLPEPRVRVPVGPEATRKVSAVLEDIVKRRYGDKQERDQSIMLMADAVVTMQSVAEMLGAVRASAAGVELFPNVMLSTGFE